MRIAVANIYKNRINLAATLKDTKTVVSKLERMVGVALHLVAILLYLTVFNVRLPSSRLLPQSFHASSAQHAAAASACVLSPMGSPSCST